MNLLERRRTCAGAMFVAGVIASIVAWLAYPAVGARADEIPPAEAADESSGGSSLDKQLLQDLAEDTSPESGSADNGPEPDAAPGTGDAGSGSLDDELLKGLGDDEADEGLSGDEGPGEESDANPLIRLSRRMREVESLIAQSRSDAATQDAQREILSELEELIKKLQQQKKKQSSSSSKPSNGQQTADRDKVQQPKPSQGQGGGKPGDEPAKDSSTELTERQAQRPDMKEMDSVLKDVWGQLPRRLREQMMQSPVDEFLPQYALQIEEYFKTLVKKKSDNP